MTKSHRFGLGANISIVFPSRSALHYDIHKSLEGIAVAKPKPSVVLRAEDVMTSCEFVFANYSNALKANNLFVLSDRISSF